MARSFNGTNQTITLPNLALLDTTTQLSISVWIYITSNPASGTRQAIISNGTGASGRNFILDYRNVSGNTLIELSNTVGASFGELRAATGVISNNVWHHVAFTADWTQVPWVGKCWLDGVSQTVTNVGAVTSGTPSSSDANRGLAIAGGIDFWKGSLADVATWKGVLLTALEVLGLAAGIRSISTREPSITGLWPLDGLQSPEPDLSGNKMNGTLSNAPTLAFGPPFAPFTPRWPMGGILPAPGPPVFNLMPQIVT